MPNGTYERIKKFSDTLPLKAQYLGSVVQFAMFLQKLVIGRAAFLLGNSITNRLTTNMEFWNLLVNWGS